MVIISDFIILQVVGFRLGWLRKIPTTRKDLKDETLMIRLCGVDAPEGAHFKRLNHILKKRYIG